MGDNAGSNGLPIGDRLLTARQVMNILHVSRSTLYGLIERGQLHPLHIGRALRFPMADLRAYVKGLRGEGAEFTIDD